MSLENAVEVLARRPLTVEEINSLNLFQKMNGIDDSDPLIVVLAYMARSHLMLEQLPAEMNKMVNESTEYHRNTLRDQSSLVAKDLVSSIALGLEKSNKYRKFDFFSHLLAFTAGALLTALLVMLLRH